MRFDKKHLSNTILLSLYKGLLKPRLIEEKMLLQIRQGKMSKWFSGIGQEAISVGATMALKKEDYIFPMHRNLGVFTSRDINLVKLFAQFRGLKEGFTKGRDRSFHFGSKKDRIVGMISHLGPQLSVADGVALANKLVGNEEVVMAFSGEGGTSEGEFHEALNVAAVWDLPVIFMLENNGYSISTPVSEQYKIKRFSEKGPAYGIETYTIDGNNVLEVYNTIRRIAEEIRHNPRPILVEALTFRMRGHEESSGNDYVSKELLREWTLKDPILCFENYLLEEHVLSEEMMGQFKKEISKEISDSIEEVDELSHSGVSVLEELQDVYAEGDIKVEIAQGKFSNKRFVDAINESLDESLQKHDNLILMGQDIAEYGGVFKVTEGLSDKYGKDRVRNTPICESAVIGAGFGLSIAGYKSVIEMQFADFVTCGFTQIVNNLAKSHYRWGQNADVVIRMPSGAGMGAGPFHSQSTEAWFFHTPGLKVVYPSSPFDAKGLLNASINDPNPVLFFEHKGLYRSTEESVADDYYTLPLGKARKVSNGSELTIVTYGYGVHWAKSLLGDYESELEIIDLRTLMPWDKEMVIESVVKTGKVIVLTEDTETGSVASEIAFQIQEECFESLDAPVKRLGSLDTPIPFNSALEDQFLPIKRLKDLVEELIAY